MCCIAAVSQLVSDYNTRKHRTFDMRPVNVTSAITKKLFEKSCTPNWTTKIFKIAKVQHTNPIIYLLRKQNENFPKKTSPVSRTITTIDEEKAILLRHDCNATTFQGLERVIKCVDAYVNQLTFIIDNECARYLIEEIKLFLTNFYINREII
ncbi:hypothetical protein ALC53_04143 [Atta colombica]|uniref:Uncharacterized protein n=1 Tax=Atta colombica TaxID=520822 RepID=A0A151I5G9_9HYME|nr:hypothetical protein ALC53_04143 [Atta colombica]